MQYVYIVVRIPRLESNKLLTYLQENACNMIGVLMLFIIMQFYKKTPKFYRVCSWVHNVL
jgi:hypothetical protein